MPILHGVVQTFPVSMAPKCRGTLAPWVLLRLTAGHIIRETQLSVASPPLSLACCNFSFLCNEWNSSLLRN